jgi:Helix-turn-helix domain
LQEISDLRERQLGTVVGTVATLVESGQVEFRPEWIDRNKLSVIQAACKRAGLDQITRLKPLKDVLPPEVTYDEIRLVVAYLRCEGNKKDASAAQAG